MSRDILDEAFRHFKLEDRKYEYGGANPRQSNGSVGDHITDPARNERDLDGDGYLGVDCSALVWRGLKNAGYDVGNSPFSTWDLFSGHNVTPYAKEHFDVLSAADAKQPNGTLQPGDIVMFSGHGSQHVGIFKGYTEKGNIEFFGSQTSTGPALTSETAPGDYWNGGHAQIVGALRAKPEFRIHDPDHGYQTGSLDYITNARAAAPKHEPDESIRLMQQQLRDLGYTDSKGRPLADDGDFGPSSRAAVNAFQQDHGLPVTGEPTAEIKQAIGEAARQQTQQQAPSPQYSPFYDLPASAPTAPLSLADPAHDGHALYCQSLSCVEQLNERKGIANDPVRDANVAGALTVEAARQGFTRIDAAGVTQDGSQLSVMQSGLISQFATVDTMQAISTSLEHSSATWDQAVQHHEQRLIEQQAQRQAAPSQAQGHAR